MAERRHACASETPPRPLTSFIGRQQDISALSQTLASTRLLRDELSACPSP